MASMDFEMMLHDNTTTQISDSSDYTKPKKERTYSVGSDIKSKKERANRRGSSPVPAGRNSPKKIRSRFSVGGIYSKPITHSIGLSHGTLRKGLGPNIASYSPRLSRLRSVSESSPSRVSRTRSPKSKKKKKKKSKKSPKKGSKRSDTPSPKSSKNKLKDPSYWNPIASGESSSENIEKKWRLNNFYRKKYRRPNKFAVLARMMIEGKDAPRVRQQLQKNMGTVNDVSPKEETKAHDLDTHAKDTNAKTENSHDHGKLKIETAASEVPSDMNEESSDITNTTSDNSDVSVCKFSRLPSKIPSYTKIDESNNDVSLDLDKSEASTKSKSRKKSLNSPKHRFRKNLRALLRWKMIRDHISDLSRSNTNSNKSEPVSDSNKSDSAIEKPRKYSTLQRHKKNESTMSTQSSLSADEANQKTARNKRMLKIRMDNQSLLDHANGVIIESETSPKSNPLMLSIANRSDENINSSSRLGIGHSSGSGSLYSSSEIDPSLPQLNIQNLNADESSESHTPPAASPATPVIEINVASSPDFTEPEMESNTDITSSNDISASRQTQYSSSAEITDAKSSIYEQSAHTCTEEDDEESGKGSISKQVIDKVSMDDLTAAIEARRIAVLRKVVSHKKHRRGHRKAKLAQSIHKKKAWRVSNRWMHKYKRLAYCSCSPHPQAICHTKTT